MKHKLIAIIVCALLAFTVQFVVTKHVVAINDRTMADRNLLDSGTVFVVNDTGTTNIVDSVVGSWIKVRLSDVYRVCYGYSYMNDICSLGILGDSGAVVFEIWSRQDARESARLMYRDTLHEDAGAANDSCYIMANDFADPDDTCWGKQVRAIVKYEIDTDTATAEFDSVILEQVRIQGWDLY